MKPSWLKVKFSPPLTENYKRIKNIVKRYKLHTICESGRCPNIAECWENNTATFMILGDICTRSCKFCATKTAPPWQTEPINWDEPLYIAHAVKLLNLKHCILTSVSRDDLPDGGSLLWAETIKLIKNHSPTTTIEALVPDFQGNLALLDKIIQTKPEIISHNLETVRRLTPVVRNKANYNISIKILKNISDSGITSKSGIMVGLGEKEKEIYETMDDLLNIGCKIFTIGQYLQPTFEHLPVVEYITPETFQKYKEIAIMKGFLYVESGPLVRSSYPDTSVVTSSAPGGKYILI